MTDIGAAQMREKSKKNMKINTGNVASNIVSELGRFARAGEWVAQYHRRNTHSPVKIFSHGSKRDSPKVASSLIHWRHR